MYSILAEIVGPDILVVLAIVALLFGGSQIPKLARSLGSAKREFEQGLADDGESEPHLPRVSEADRVTMTRGELDALLVQKEQAARREKTE